MDQPDQDEEIRRNTQQLFRDEDLTIIEAQQRYLESENDGAPVLLPPDEGAVRTRRVLDVLITQETQSGSAPAPQ